MRNASPRKSRKKVLIMPLWFLAAFAAFFVKGLCGFANTLAFTTILSFGQSNAGISPIDLLLGFPANLVTTWQNRQKLDRSIWLPLSVFVLVGNVPGAFVLKNADVRALRMFFGFVVVALGLSMFFRKSASHVKRKWLWILTAVAAGVLCGLFGVGALTAACIGSATNDSRTLKANVSVVFLIENTFRIALYAALGLFTSNVLRTTLFVLPFAVAGFFCGSLCAGKWNDHLVSRITAALLTISGAALILTNL